MRRPNLHAGLHQALGRWYLCLALSSGSARRASFWPPDSDFANHHQRPRLSSGLRPAQDEGERSQRGLGRAHADGAARAAQAAGHGAAGCRGGLGQLRGGVGLPQPTARRSRRMRCHTTGGTSPRPAVCPNCAYTTRGTPTQLSRWPQAYIRRSCRKARPLDGRLHARCLLARGARPARRGGRARGGALRRIGSVRAPRPS